MIENFEIRQMHKEPDITKSQPSEEGNPLPIPQTASADTVVLDILDALLGVERSENDD